MKKFSRITFIFCGLLIQLAAFPVFGQNEKPVETSEIYSISPNNSADYVLEKIEKDKVDITQSFKVVLEGSLIKKNENEREIVILDKEKSKWIQLSDKEAGNKEVGEIVKKIVDSFSGSGFLGYFYDLGIKDFRLDFYQDENAFTVNLESEMETAERAKTLASGLKAFFQVAKMQVKKEDEKILLSGFQTPTTKDKTLLINFELPKNTVHEIINRNLTDYKSRKLSEQK